MGSLYTPPTLCCDFLARTPACVKANKVCSRVYFSSNRPGGRGLFDPTNVQKYLSLCHRSHPLVSLIRTVLTSNISNSRITPFDLNLPKVLSGHAGQSQPQGSQSPELSAELQRLVVMIAGGDLGRARGLKTKLGLSANIRW